MCFHACGGQRSASAVFLKKLATLLKNVTFLFVLYVGVCFLGCPCRDLGAVCGSWFFPPRGPEDQTQVSALVAITFTL